MFGALYESCVCVCAAGGNEDVDIDGGYEVEMGFGLHIGWAIEGAIGSKFKIDASYLSP